jgi:hypothetical protein
MTKGTKQTQAAKIHSSSNNKNKRKAAVVGAREI